MTETPARPASPTGVLVVGEDAELLAQLGDYLKRAGVEVRTTRRLDEAWRRGSSEAVVLFPDDYDAGEVSDGLSRLLGASAPCPLAIVITASPRLFEPLLDTLDKPESIVVMPRPVWGWTILDLLRGS